MGLSLKSHEILSLVAKGYGYDSILQRMPDCTFFDIAAAAKEAIELPHSAARRAMTPRRQGLKWEREEEERLRRGFLAGESLAALCHQHERSARSLTVRLEKLGLLGPEEEFEDAQARSRNRA